MFIKIINLFFKSTQSERVLFSLMTNMRLPLIEPFDTTQAEKKYKELFNQNKLIVSTLVD
jgi:hypothetical protein